MPSQLKIEQVESLREKLQEAEAVFICEYRGLNVAKITALRASIRGAGGEMNVAKNTLMGIALREESMPVPDSLMTGPNSFTIAYSDAAAVAKVIRDFSRRRATKPSSSRSCPGGRHPLRGTGQGPRGPALEGGPAGAAGGDHDRPRERPRHGALRHHPRARDVPGKDKGTEGRKSRLKYRQV